jgi:signal transduction histidine kinase
MLAPALLSPPSAWPLAVMAALTLATAIQSWPPGRNDDNGRNGQDGANGQDRRDGQHGQARLDGRGRRDGRGGRITLAHAATGAAALSLVTDLVYPGPPGAVIVWYPFETAALLVVLERVVRHVTVPRVAVVGTLTAAAAILLPLRSTLHNPQTGLKESVFAASLCLLPAACATGVGLYLRSLDTRRRHAVALARREQRLEVARDLHDFVAHEVTGILMEVQAAQIDDRDADDPEEWRALLTRVEQASLRALESMDRTVTTLRGAKGTAEANTEGGTMDEPPPTRPHGPADLPELVDRFSAGTTAEVTLTLPDWTVTGDLSRETEETAYRVVLEALTNVRRHAARTGRVEVCVRRSADGRAVELSVTDAGGGTAPARPRRGGGMGLAGLAERVAALGGALEAGPTEQGWRVRCVLPTAARGTTATTPRETPPEH